MAGFLVVVFSRKKILYINKPVEMSNNKQSVKEPSLVLKLKSSEVDHSVSTFHGIDVLCNRGSLNLSL